MSQKYPDWKFKAECLRLVDRVKKYGHSITITKHGKVVAKLVPANDAIEGEMEGPFGIMEGTGEIHGEIVNPIEESWNSYKK